VEKNSLRVDFDRTAILRTDLGPGLYHLIRNCKQQFFPEFRRALLNDITIEPERMHENIHNADWLLKDGSDKEVHAFLELAGMRGNIDRLRGALDDLEE